MSVSKSLTARRVDRVAVVGLGYIGLPTAAVLATNGIDVVGIDTNPETVRAVSNGEVPFAEPDLSIHVAGAVSQGRLTASSKMPHADAYIIAVPTPFRSDKSADLSFIESATRSIAPMLRGGELIILESTSPPGTTLHIADLVLSLRPDLSLDGSNRREKILVAHCPERVLPGRIMIEIVTNDRIIGGLTSEASQAARNLYQIFCQGEILLTDAATAEMAKLVENAYRDVNIAFANELSVISDGLDIDVWELINLANHHPRVNILQPGPGVGGHCIAVDPWFIVAADPVNSKLIRAAREVNDSKPRHIVEKIVKSFGSCKNPVLSILGLAFKANVDDVRESPAIEIVKILVNLRPDIKINISAPLTGELPSGLRVFPNIEIMSTDESILSAQVVALLVDHDVFRDIDPGLLEGKKIIDTRGMWSDL